jgi:hypothetical protein
MTNHLKLIALLAITSLMFSCQKTENVTPQKPTTNQSSRITRSSNVLELFGLYLQDKIKVYDDFDLRLTSSREVISGRLAENGRVKVASPVATEKATFMKDKLIFFDVNKRVVGALKGRLASDALVTVRGTYGKVVKFLAGTEIMFSPDRANLGVVFGTLGWSTQLTNANGTTQYYLKGTRVTFDEQGRVRSAS